MDWGFSVPLKRYTVVKHLISNRENFTMPIQDIVTIENKEHKLEVSAKPIRKKEFGSILLKKNCQRFRRHNERN